MTVTLEQPPSAGHTARLTAAEMGFLWTQYQNDTLAVCVLQYFMKHCEDRDIRQILEYALSSSKSHVQFIAGLYAQENLPLPVGFTGQDVHSDAPRLFSDVFMLIYLQNMSVIGMAGASVAVGVSARSDVSGFFREVLISAVELHDRVRGLGLAKGTYIRPPYISPPDKADFVTKQSFLFDVFGKNKRPLTAIEITHLFLNVQTNAIGKAMMMAFAQVCHSEEAKDFFLKGKQIANKHIKLFTSTLTNEDIPAPMSPDS